jgi:hypothetical protein
MCTKLIGHLLREILLSEKRGDALLVRRHEVTRRACSGARPFMTTTTNAMTPPDTINAFYLVSNLLNIPEFMLRPV